MPLIVVEKGHDKGKAIPIPTGGTILIGRDSSTSLPLRDTMASRMHCKIQAEEDGFYLSDLESMNGTYLNGERVREPVKLAFGDLIKIGDTLFTFLSDDTAATTLAGQRIGGYRIIERVGRGGMGTVYKAEQIDLQRIVALKVISEEHTKDKDFVDLFIHEARAAAKLNHPNIVQVYDVKRHNDYYYFSMEFVSGGSVQEILNKQRKMAVDQAAQMVLEAARGLDYAHKKGIVHRDVKPDNLMISETGMIKIGDMGLARGLEEKIGPEEETSVIGTPHYIAPEQVLGRQADFRSDIYSLGATAYRMLAGVTPFSAPSVRDLVNKKVREDAQSIQDHTSDCPKVVAEIVVRMMARDPERRYQSMSEVIAALEKYLRGQADATAAERRQQTTTVGMLVASRKFLVGAAALLFLLVGGYVLWAFLSDAPELPPGPIGPQPVDARMADQALDLAKMTELKRMDKQDPRSIEDVVSEYSSVVERFPGSLAARRAAERRAALEGLLREARSNRRLAQAELDDIGNYRKATQPFQPRRPDLAPIQATIDAYDALSKADDVKGTPAGMEAAARAAHVRKWKAQIEDLKSGFDRVILEVQACIEVKRFREGVNALGSFQEISRRAELECPFARDRYRTLFYDQAAIPELEKVSAEARYAWTRQEAEARSMARDKNYEGAIKHLDAVIAESVDEVVVSAKQLREMLDADWASMTRREIEEKETAAAAARAKALTAFAQESQAARDLFLKHDFKGALLRIKTLRDQNLSEDLRPRLERRVAELERAVHFKESLINVIKARDASGANPYRFKVDFRTQGLEGIIDDADEKGIKVKLGVGGGIDHGWAQFDPRGYYDFVKAHWKYNKEQKSVANDQCDLAVVCMEFGLYEEALDEIKWVTDAMKDSLYVVPDSVKKFCEEYKARIEKGESAEFGEIEAQKRLARLEAFMKSKEYAAARHEIDILRAWHRKTTAFEKGQQRIDEHLQTINKDGSEVFNRNLKEDRYRALQNRLDLERDAARKAQPDIVSRINRMDDVFERSLNLGAVYAAAGEWRISSDKYGEARKHLEGMLSRREAGRELMPVLAMIYGELYRNAVLLKDKKGAEAIRNLGAQRFQNPDTQAPEDYWATLVNWLGAWSENIHPQEEKKLAKLREEARANPEDPAKIWALAQTCSEGVFNMVEARGYYAWLLENHPEFQQVTNGNCLYRLAEINFGAREIREAMKRFGELNAQYKEHPKVADASASNSVKKRLDECYKLLNKMGYSKEKK